MRNSATALEVLPLNHDEVRRWRAQSLPAGTPWAPAMIRVRGTEVRAWSGRKWRFHWCGIWEPPRRCAFCTCNDTVDGCGGGWTEPCSGLCVDV